MHSLAAEVRIQPTAGSAAAGCGITAVEQRAFGNLHPHRPRHAAVPRDVPEQLAGQRDEQLSPTAHEVELLASSLCSLVPS